MELNSSEISSICNHELTLQNSIEGDFIKKSSASPFEEDYI